MLIKLIIQLTTDYPTEPYQLIDHSVNDKFQKFYSCFVNEILKISNRNLFAHIVYGNFSKKSEDSLLYLTVSVKSFISNTNSKTK